MGDSESQGATPAFLAGGGEMGALLRAHDWTATPLGPPQNWPQALKTTVRIALTTRHPVFIFWGGAHICLYNDAYRALVGPEKHPAMLGSAGREVWGEIWDVIGPQIETVLAGGGATWHENQLVPILRHGRLEDVYWTYSFGPIDDDSASNGVGGVLVLCTETTETVLAEQTRAQETKKLRESEAFTRLLLDSTTEAFYAVDRDGVATLCNDAFLLMLGFASEADVLGRTLHELIHHSRADGSHYPVDECPIHLAATTGQPADVRDEVFFRSDGSPFPVEYRAAPIVRDGKVEGAICTFTDVTQRRLEAALLEENQELFRSLAESMPQLVWMADTDGNVRWYNQRWYDYTGTTFEQMQGWGWQKALDRARLADVVDHWKASLTSGMPMQTTCPIKGKDGAFRPFLTRVEPVKDARGRVLRWFGTNTDITELTAAQNDLRHLAEISEIFATVQDVQSTLAGFAAHSTGYFCQWCVIDLFRPDGQAERQACAHTDPAKLPLVQALPQPIAASGPAVGILARVLAGGKAELHRLNPPDLQAAFGADPASASALAQLAPRSLVAVPLTVRGRSLGAIGFARGESAPPYGDKELTLAREVARRVAIALDNAQLYDDLRLADRRKDEFLATLAHELRNPLAPIRFGADLLRRLPGDADKVAETGVMIERQLGQMVRLVDDLMDVSRITTGKIRLQKQPLALRPLLQDAVDSLRATAGKAGVAVTLAPGDAPLMVNADAVRLTQVVVNLLTNAIKFSDAGAPIAVGAQADGAQAVVTIKDQGIGIAPGDQKRIFDLFTQVGAGPGRVQAGLGIGLSLARALVELHGGKLEVKSAGLGHGTEVVLRLPALATPAVAPGAATAGDTPRALAHRILVVDDNRDAADSLAEFLRLSDQQVNTCYGGEAALEAAEALRPNLVLLDIGMPGLSGHEVCRRLRARPWAGDLTIVALTGWGQQEDRRRSREAGFDQHLIKPVDPDALLRLLEQVAPRN